MQRFLSEDPIGLAGGLNVYTYTSNSPLNHTDPSGLATRTNYKMGTEERFFWDWYLVATTPGD